MSEMVKVEPETLVEYVARNLVKKKDEVETKTIINGATLVIELRVNSEDLGTVIGKGGRIAKAIRTLLGSISTRQLMNDEGHTGKIHKVNLEIIDQ